MPKTRSQIRAENKKSAENTDSECDESDVSMIISKKRKRKLPVESLEKTIVPERRKRQKKDPVQEPQEDEEDEEDGEEDEDFSETNADRVDLIEIENNDEVGTSGKLQIGLALLQSAMSQMISETIKKEIVNISKGKNKKNPKSKIQKLLQGEEEENEEDEENEEELGDTQIRDQLEEKIDELYNLEDEDDDEQQYKQISEEKAQELLSYVEKIQGYRKDRVPNIIKILSTKMAMEDKSKILDWFMMYNFSTEPHSEERIALRNLIQDYITTNSLNETEDLEKIEKTEEKYRKIVDSKKSIRQRIHDLNTSEANKAVIYGMFDDLMKTPSVHEEYEEKRHRLETILDFPFGVIKPLPVHIGKSKPEEIHKFLSDVRRKLDKNILYVEDVKDQIITYVSSCILNPNQTPGAIALEGAPGVGKTTLILKGVSEALDLPFFHLNGGGINDIHELRGSDKVYRNSGPGLLLKYAIEAKCLNFVFYFDEADKTSNRSNEVLSYMVHFFDNTSNTKIQDSYYKGLSFDFSKCLKFVSYNSRIDLGDVFGDRIQKFIMEEYTYKQKQEIIKQIIVPRYLKQSGLEGKVSFSSEACERILSKQQVQEKGMRQACRNVENLIKTLGTIFIMIKPGKKRVPDLSSVLKNIDISKCQKLFSNVKLPLKVSPDMVELLWYEPKSDSTSVQMMYS